MTLNEIKERLIGETLYGSTINENGDRGFYSCDEISDIIPSEQNEGCYDVIRRYKTEPKKDSTFSLDELQMLYKGENVYHKSVNVFYYMELPPTLEELKERLINKTIVHITHGYGGHDYEITKNPIKDIISYKKDERTYYKLIIDPNMPCDTENGCSASLLQRLSKGEVDIDPCGCSVIFVKEYFTKELNDL